MGLKKELGKLEYLSLVSKVCTELDNHLGMDDKDLAKFVINLVDKNPKFETFRNELIQNGADFSGGLMRSLFDLVNRMKGKNEIFKTIRQSKFFKCYSGKKCYPLS